MRLTTKAIKAFKHSDGWDVRWDDAVPGLGVRVYPSGKRSFVLSYRVGGRKRLLVLGRFGADLTLDQARDEARSLRVQVRQGRDPSEEKRKAAHGSTFGDLQTAYIERHAVRKKTGSEDERNLRSHAPRSWKGRPVQSITRSEVAALHAKIGATAPYQANRVLALLRVMFRLAETWGFVDEGHPNPATKIEKFAERKRTRWVTREELPRIAQAIDTSPNIYVRAALWLYLLTGVRKTELLRAQWDHVDFERGVLRLPETKSGEEQVVALSAAALSILQSVPRLENNPHILPGAKEGGHLVNIDKPWRVIRAAAGVEDVRLHDLRRTVGSWLTQAGVDLNLVKDALRHSNISTTLIYARLGQDAARDAMEEHGKRILEAAGKMHPVEVATGGCLKA